MGPTYRSRVRRGQLVIDRNGNESAGAAPRNAGNPSERESDGVLILINAACVVVLLASLGNVVGQAHRFSDGVASVLLVGAVSGVVLAVLRPTPR